MQSTTTSESQQLEAFAVNTLKLSHYRSYLLVAYFRFLSAKKLTTKEKLNHVKIT